MRYWLWNSWKLRRDETHCETILFLHIWVNCFQMQRNDVAIAPLHSALKWTGKSFRETLRKKAQTKTTVLFCFVLLFPPLGFPGSSSWDGNGVSFLCFFVLSFYSLHLHSKSIEVKYIFFLICHQKEKVNSSRFLCKGCFLITKN